jgi:CubicO group peptidase (beta-lactamase class C family)
MDYSKLQAVREFAFTPDRKTQSVLIVRHGAIVAEWYAEHKSPSDHATSWSVAKSFLSALVGIAIERGELPSVDEPLATYIPQFQGTDREAITFRHALQMRSGLAPHQPEIIYFQLNQRTYAAFRTVAEPPGGTWIYQNSDSMLVAQALEAAVQRDLIAYAHEVLFDPLGMSPEWWTDAEGHPLGYCCIDATARDFARFGLLFARGGMWGEEEVLPSTWVTESTRPVADDMPYALHWWAFDNGTYYAAIGALNQSIWIFPEYDLVVLRNSLYRKRGQSGFYQVFEGSYHDTPEPRGWNEYTFLRLIFEAVKDYTPRSDAPLQQTELVEVPQQ